MLKSFLYTLMEIIASLHERLMALNDARGWALSDKMLHFYVIGILGLALVLVIHPLFKYLADNDHVMVITWLYVFTVIIVLTFAIEIGQQISGSGAMEFADIVFGIGGFLLIFLLFAAVRGIILMILHLFKK
jgi:hypothetical protein